MRMFDKNIKPGKIFYFKLDSGLLIKIDRERMTAYRFNEEKSEWQEDSEFYIDYSYGNLFGSIVDITENYPIGEPYDYRKALRNLAQSTKQYNYYLYGSSIIIKIDTESNKLYVLDKNSKTWQEDFYLESEYQYGKLHLKEYSIKDDYLIGKPQKEDSN